MAENEKAILDNVLTPQINSETVKEKQNSTELIRESSQTDLVNHVPNPWKLSKKGKQAVSQGVAMFQTGFGLYAAIPLLCKGEECPYALLFPELHEAGVEDGERCPVEVSFIMSKYQQYIKELDIEEEDAVDMSLLRDLIDFDVQILRADNRIAVEGGFTEDQIVAIDEKTGSPVYREEITATANYKDKVQVKRNKTLELLNSTRKDKAGAKINHVLDPSSYAAQLLKKAHENNSLEVIADFDEIEVIEDVPYMRELKKAKSTSSEKKDEQKTLSFEEMYFEEE